MLFRSDLRGWGKSDRHNEDYNLFTQADDVEGVIEKLNLMDFVFVSHSMDGKIAQILAGHRPVGLPAVVLVAQLRLHLLTSPTHRSNPCSIVTQR